jgi:hypothetical protein
MVGTWENKEQGSCLAALTLGTGQLTTRLLEQPARSPSTPGHSKQQRLQGAAVVITSDQAPGHRGARVQAM